MFKFSIATLTAVLVLLLVSAFVPTASEPANLELGSDDMQPSTPAVASETVTVELDTGGVEASIPATTNNVGVRYFSTDRAAFDAVEQVAGYRVSISINESPDWYIPSE